MKIFQKKLLSASVSTALTLTVCSAIPMSQASDISIYSDSTKGKTGILLMLDTSGSMGISSLVIPKNNSYGSPGDVNRSLCDPTSVTELTESTTEPKVDFTQWTYNAKDMRGTQATNPTYNKTAFQKTVTVNGKEISYYLRGCGTATIDKNGNLVESTELGKEGKFDRLSRLKDAVIQLLASEELDSNVKIGLGHFSTKTKLTIGDTTNKLVDGHSGTILVPVLKLTPEQREDIISTLASIKSIDTLTLEDGSLITETVRDKSNKNATVSTLRLTGQNYPDMFKSSSGTPTVHAYAEAGAYMMGTTTGVYPGKVPTKTTILYDGYAVIKNNKSNHADYKKQLYYVCVGLDPDKATGTGVPGTTAMFCDNEWNRGMDKSGVFYDSSNGKKRPGDLVRIYKPKDGGGWEQVTPEQFKTQFGAKESVWEIHKALPIGWRWGGWLKVENEPLDIEPIGAKVWDHHGSDTKNMVSYRSSPFSLESINKVPVENMVGGFTYSAPATKNTTTGKYIAGGSTSQCDGNGIYFLTDGAPNSTKDSMARTIMNLTLGSHGFSNKPTANILASPTIQASVFDGETGGWEYIGAYAKKLKDKTQNPGNMTIKTAVVGFGSSFEDLKDTQDCEALVRANPTGYNKDAYNACKWGSDEYGGGGFYYAENSDDIRNSILDFVRKVEVDIKPVATGTPTIPVDALNPTTLQNDAYYASFQPTVSSVSQIWMGNLNKYRIKNGELFSADGSQRLISSTGALNDAAQGFWMGGVLGQLKVGADFLADGKTTTHRKIFTNRTITDSTASASKDLQVVDVDALFDGAFAGDSDKLYWLNALGYKLNEVPTNFTKANLSTYATDKRLGAVMHSTPVLLTQEGQISVLTNNLVTTNRKDYLMYGSTQGVLHVVDVSTGQEVFGFLPHEMMVNQKQALLLNDKTTGGMSNLFYGIDAPWVAHTQYTTKNNGLLTVKESDRTETDEEDSEAFLKGHQWVYGGLRMGGKSYYALNLTDINNPKMMFHIDPSTSASEPLQRMGESWSKPTLAYVNWGGEKKLVMFVGGGYDREGNVECTDDTTATNKGYECPTYKQTNKIGAGVYMFDAQNGDLLWWTSADDNGTTDTKIRFTANTDLQYSVVSQINAIDRNADGLVDHLYFGDLAGQAFRVDLNNNPVIEQPEETDPEKPKEAIEDAKKNAFATRTVTLFTEHSADGLSPRFYEMPSVSVHTDTDTGALFAAAAFSSGNRSAPLADSAQSANDGVFVVYDNDVVAKGLYAANYTLATTKENKLQALAIGNAVSRKTGNMFNAGWKHSFSSTAGSYKGMNDIYALDGMLYVNVFHKDGIGISGSCGGGVKGDSYLYQYCLPYGKCDFYTIGTTSPNRVKLGAGILGTGIGQGYGNKISTLGLIVNRDNPTPVDCALPVNKNLPQCQLFDNAVKLKQLRWYEAQ